MPREKSKNKIPVKTACDCEMTNQKPKTLKGFVFRNISLSILIGLIAAGIFFSALYVLASAWPYVPPAPLEPGCSTTDSTCIVKAPLTDGFTTDFSGSGKITTTDTITGGTLKVGSAYTLPTADGTIGYVLTTDGAGTISWQVGGAPAVWDRDTMGNFLYPATSGDGLLMAGTIGGIPASGAGTRLMWVPSLAAFRAGIVLGAEWDSGNIGSYSVAMGAYTTASGYASTALGFNTTASGQYSLATGQATTASGSMSTAMGYTTQANGDYSTAMGSFSIANGPDSIAVGNTATTSGESGVAMGENVTATGEAAIAMGLNATAGARWSTAIGDTAHTLGQWDTAIGRSTTASGGESTALGAYTVASGGISTAMGYVTTASGLNSTAIGYYTTASGDYSTAMGDYTTADGDFSTAMGYKTTANGDSQTVIGQYNISNGTKGDGGPGSGDYAFIIGNGYYSGGANYSNALTVDWLGNTTIGNQLAILEGGTSPTYHTIFQGGDQTGDVTYTLPTASSNGLLKNTAGVLSWDGTAYLASESDTWDSVMQRGNTTSVYGKINIAGAADTMQDGLWINNSTRATSPVPVQYSPDLRLTGSAWWVNGSDPDMSIDHPEEWALQVEPVSGINTSSFLDFMHHDNSSWGSKMVISSAGNVGIGTASPNQKLTVNGTLGILEGGASPTYHTILQGGDQSADITYVLPTTQGAASTFLQNNGSGVLSWAAGPSLYWSRDAVNNDVYPTTSGDGLYISGSTGTSPASLSTGDYLMWVPASGAFRVGHVNGTQWDYANLGIDSFASGFNAKANGAYSIAIGSVTTASGLGSVAMGDGAIASGDESVAMGESTTASGLASTATGYGTIANGDSQTAIGKYNISDTSSALIIGNGTGTGTRSNLWKFSWTGDIISSSDGTDRTIGFSSGFGGGKLTIKAGDTGTTGSNLRLLGGVGFTTGGGTYIEGGAGGVTYGNVLLGCTDDATCNGMVGIGNTSPSQLLSVGSSGQFTVDTSGNTSTSGTGAFTGGIKTKDNTSAPTLTANGQIQTAHVGTDYRLYFYSDGAQHYTSMTAGFTIPGFETADPISGDKIKVGDIVLGMINQNVGDEENSKDSSLHGIWVKWDSVKAQLLAEARGELAQSGTWGTGSISGVSTETLLDRVTNVLTGLGISIKDGVTNITTLVTEKFTTKTARMERMEMVTANGDVYCTWIDDSGEWQKVKGECGSVAVATAAAQSSALSSVPAVTETAPSSQNQAVIDAAQQAVQAAQQAVQAVQETQQSEASSQQNQMAINIAQQAAQAAQQAQQTASQAQQAASQAQESVQQVQEQVQGQPLAVNIVSVASVADISVEYGTELAYANLPATLNVTLSDGSSQTVLAVWDNGIPTYDASTPGTYVFTGTLTFTGNITNTTNIKAMVNVIVLPPPEPRINSESTINATSELIHGAAKSLFNGILDLIKWMFGPAKKVISNIPGLQNAVAGLARVPALFQSIFLRIYEPIASWIR